MKLNSVRTNNGEKITVENAVFDPAFANNLYEAEQNIIMLDYDATEFGHCLKLPFEVGDVTIGIRITENGNYISLLAESATDDIDDSLLPYCDSVGSIEFDVEMTDDEEKCLLRKIITELQNKGDNQDC